MSETTLNLLLVDDEHSVRIPLARHLSGEPYRYLVKDVASVEEALQAIDEANGRFDVALIDEVLGEGALPSGLDLLRQIKSKYPQIECILFTGWGMRSGMEALAAGAYRYFAKPFNLEELALTIRFAAEEGRRRLEQRFLSALVKVSQGLTQTTQMDRQLALAWEFVRGQLEVSTFFIGLSAPRGDRVYFPLAFDKGQRVTLPDLMLGENRSDWGLAGYVVKTGEEVLWSTSEERERVCADRKIFPRLEGEPSTSCFCVPLVIGNQVRGVLSAQSYQPHVFIPPLQNALRALAGHLSVALENSRLVDELRQRAADNQVQAERIAALERLAVSINSNLELEEILTQTCQAAADFFHADHSGLVIFDEDRVQGVVEAEYPDLGARGQPIPLRGIPLEEHLIESCKPLIIPDVSGENGLGEVREIMLNLGIQSSLFVPVIGKSGLLGSFSLDSIHQKRRFSEDEIELCQIFASQVAVAIENGRLYRQAQEGRDYLHALFKASAEVISPREPQDVLQSIVFQACHSTGAWRAAALLVDEGGHPQILATWNFDHHLEAATSVRETGISRQVIASGKPRFIEDMEAEAQDVHPAMLAQGVKAAACLPLPRGGRTIGVLWIHYQEKHPFSDAEKQALQIYANQSAVAYDNARHIRELEQLREATEAMAKEAEPKRVLRRIVEGARRVLGADIAVIWSYDPDRGRFLPEELTAEGVPEDILEEFRREEPRAGKTTNRVLEQEYLKVTDVEASLEIGDPTRVFLTRLGVQSFQGIRLDVAGERLGVLYADYKTPRDFGKEERRILEHFAHHAALTLKKARLLTQIKRAREAARVITEVTTLGKLDDTLKVIVKGAKDVLGSDIVTLYTFDEKTQRFVQAEGEGYRKRSNLRPPQEVAVDSSLWRVVNLGEPYYHAAEDAPNDRLLQGGFVRNEKVRSALGVQLRFEGERVGVMFVNYRTPHRFTEAEIADALQFGNQAAVAIRNAQLFEERERVRERQELVASISQKASANLELVELLDTLYQELKRVLRVPILPSTALWDERQCCLRLVESKSYDYKSKVIESEKRRECVQLGEGITGWVAEHKEPLIIPNVDHEPRYKRFVPTTKSELAVPILYGQEKELIGVLDIESSEENAFGEEEFLLVQTLANQLAVAIHNAQLHERTKRQAETLKGLYEAGKAVTGLLDLDEILKRIAEQAWGLVGRQSSYAVIRLVEGEVAKVVAVHPANLVQRRDPIPVIDLKTGVNGRIGVTGRTIRTGEPQLVNDVHSDNDYIVSEPQVNSELAVPIKLGESVIGVINVDSPEPQAFTEEDQHTLTSLASYAAIAINNAQLHERARKQATTLKGLYEAGKAITSTLALEETLARVAEQALNIVGASPQEGCFSHIALREGEKLRFIAGWPLEILDDLRKNVGEIDLQKDEKKGIAGHAVLERQSQKVDDVSENDNYIPLRKNINIRSQLSVPLKIGERIIGVLSLEHPKPTAFSDEDVHNLEALAAQAAVAIENARRFGETEKMLAARTALAWTGMLGSTWRHAVEKHAITIREQIQLLRSDLASKAKVDPSERLERIERLANQILEKPMTPPLSAEEGVISLPINDFLRERARQLWAHEPYKSVSLKLDLKLDETATVRTSPEWLRRALDILIDNAVKAAEASPERKIVLGSQQHDHYAEISIVDNGQGIPPDVQESLFREPIKKPQGAKGQGIGLLLAQAIVQTYGGSISCRETGPTGTTMVISLPLEL